MQSPNTPEITEIQFIRHLLPEIREYLLSRNKTPDLPLQTLPLLSDKIRGIPRKCLTVIGARTSEGKSTFACQIAHDLSSQGFTVLFLSLEMTSVKIGARLYCYQQKVPNTTAFAGGVKDMPDTLNKFEIATKMLPLVINDFIGKNWQDIDELVSNTELNPDVIIVDYIQTISKSAKTEMDSINEYIRHFRELAIRKNFAGIICSQLNRTKQDSDSKEPQLHQLKSSGFIEEHADLVILLHWPYKYDNRNINSFSCFIAKNKDGSTGYHKLRFIPEVYLFSEAPEEDKQEKIKFKPELLQQTTQQQETNWDE